MADTKWTCAHALCDRPVSVNVAFCCSWCASASQQGRPPVHVVRCDNRNGDEMTR